VTCRKFAPIVRNVASIACQLTSPSLAFLTSKAFYSDEYVELKAARRQIGRFQQSRLVYNFALDCLYPYGLSSDGDGTPIEIGPIGSSSSVRSPYSAVMPESNTALEYAMPLPHPDFFRSAFFRHFSLQSTSQFCQMHHFEIYLGYFTCRSNL
jgi:hypothetical protein